MTTRDKHIAQKRKEIEKISKQQIKLIKKAIAIPIMPSKRMDVNFRRAGKSIAIAMQVRMLEIQKQLIISQPILKGSGFLPGGPAIVGETGPEAILTINDKIEIK